MGSSGGDDTSTPPQQPAPPANLISPYGSSTPDPGWQGMSFLHNGTSQIGDMAALEPQFAAMSAPPVAPGGAAGNAAAPHPENSPEVQRQILAQTLMQSMGKRPDQVSVMRGGGGPPPPREAFAGQGNRGDWGGSGGRGRGPY